jgi:hypothetical protein
MSWRRRLQELVLAGGAFAFADCSGELGAGRGGAGGTGTGMGTAGGAPGSGGQLVGVPVPSGGEMGGTGGPVTTGGQTGGTGGSGGSSGPPPVPAPPVVSPPSIPCGNANPDPCICDRPKASVEAKALCDAQMACKAMGGRFDPTTLTDGNGVVHPPHCDVDGGAIDGGGQEGGRADGRSPDTGSDGR